MAERLHFKNVRILDGTGTGLFEGEVEIEGGRITRVAKGETKKADGGQVIDGNGATLMPGLCDAHIHFSWNEPSPRYPRAAAAREDTIRHERRGILPCPGRNLSPLGA